MSSDLIVQPIAHIRAAVDVIRSGLAHGEVFTAEQWDGAVTTLARCHDQVGGETRRHLYDVFMASTEGLLPDEVAPALEALAAVLQRHEASPTSDAPGAARRRR